MLIIYCYSGCYRIDNNESDGDYSKGEHESDDNDANDDTYDEGVPQTTMAVHHAEDHLLFMRALHLEAMHAPKFPKYANMTCGYATDGELCVGITLPMS